MSVNKSSARVCIVTPDFSGPVKNGGIGTVYTSLARVLAKSGMQVTVLYTLGKKSEIKSIDYWVDFYSKENIKLVPLPDPEVGNENAPIPLLRSYSVYEWLKGYDFDFVHFPDWMGLSFYCVQAKKMGVGFLDTCLVVGCHGPTLWNWQGNRQIPKDPVVFTHSYMEKVCAENADYVISSSRHLIEWMGREGWNFSSESTLHRKNIYYNVCSGENNNTSSIDKKIKEIVFCGRLEFRKGLHIFCDSLKRLDGLLDDNVKFTIVGKPVERSDFNSLEFIKDKTQQLARNVEVHTDFDIQQLVEYLSSDQKLAVIPSTSDNSPMIIYDFLNNDIPFITSNVGGIPELIAADDWEAVLFDPTVKGLTAKISSIIDHDIFMPKPAEDPEKVNEEWVSWHNDVLQSASYVSCFEEIAELEDDVITVCLVHHERPKELEVALTALEAQTFKRFTVIVVDDGSQKESTINYLDGLAERFEKNRWTLVRQENSYVGAARNNAARRADTKYLVFMDDDNVAKPEELEVMYNSMERSNSDILTTFADVFECDWRSDLVPRRRILFAGGILSNSLWVNIMSDANAIMKKEVFDRVGGYHEKFGTGLEDFHFFVRAALKGCSIYVIPEALFWYKISENRIRKKHYSMDDGKMMILDAYINEMPMHLREMLFSAYSRSVANSSAITAREGGRAVLSDTNNVPGWSRYVFNLQKRIFNKIISIQRALIYHESRAFEKSIYLQAKTFYLFKKIFTGK